MKDFVSHDIRKDSVFYEKPRRDFASYEKSVECVVTTTTHTIRIKVNSTPSEIIDLLNYIPKNATLSTIDDDGRNSSSDYGELVFTESA